MPLAKQICSGKAATKIVGILAITLIVIMDSLKDLEVSWDYGKKTFHSEPANGAFRDSQQEMLMQEEYEKDYVET